MLWAKIDSLHSSVEATWEFNKTREELDLC
jgi:hypothetical protein